MRPSEQRDRLLAWSMFASVAVVAGIATADAWGRIGTITPGFSFMANMEVAIADRSGLEPFARIATVNGRPAHSHRDLHELVESRPEGTLFRYRFARSGGAEEREIASRRVSSRDFRLFLFDSLLPGLLVLAIASAGAVYRPGSGESRLFLGFCLLMALSSLLWTDFNSTHRFARPFLVVWAFEPAAFTHLALMFPERRAIARRWPWLAWPPYVLSGVLAIWLQKGLLEHGHPAATVVAVYWGLSLVALLLSLARTGTAGTTPLIRQRARVLLVGFAAGFLLPIAGAIVEIVLRVSVPYLAELWRLTFLFPLAVAYAIVRYQLFDIRAVLRAGAVYSVITALVVVAYVGVLTVVNVLLAGVSEGVHPVVSAAIVAAAVVLLLNPLYGRLKTFIDRLFFRDRHDTQRALERLVDAMITVRELPRIAALIGSAVDEVLRPAAVALFVAEDGRSGYRQVPGTTAVLEENSALVRRLARERQPLTRVGLQDDPRVSEDCEACLREMDALGAEVVTPVLFRDGLTGLLIAGPRPGDVPYTTQDLRYLRSLVNQSAVALENAKAYTALQAALRRVEILESIRSNLSKFVPQAVQDLIERAPEGPELAKQEADVSVLFVDLVGYTRLSEQLDPAAVNEVVERYFGAFLDEIIERGGDVNETAGDGLMVIFQDPDPVRHARAAALTALGILRRAREINAEPGRAVTVALRLGVNSGMAAVGATKIEGRAGARWTYTASGRVTNVAARLADLGVFDTALIGPETRRRLDDAFRASDLGERSLKNVDEPLRVYALGAEESDGELALRR